MKLENFLKGPLTTLLGLVILMYSFYVYAITKEFNAWQAGGLAIAGFALAFVRLKLEELVVEFIKSAIDKFRGKQLSVIFILLLPAISFAQSTDAQLTTQNATTIRGNIYNATKAGDMHQAIINSKVNYSGNINIGPYSSINLSTNSDPTLIDGRLWYNSVAGELRAQINGSTVTLRSGTLNPMTTTGDLIVSSDNSGTPSRLAAVATGNALISNGVGSLPTWGKINLANSVSGNLQAVNVNSGTGASTSTYLRGDMTWASVTAAASLGALTPAIVGNTIDNTNFQQEWQWSTLGAGSGLKLSSNSTAAASNTQKLLEVSQSGANATNSQTTYSSYFTNNKTGGGSPTNIGGFFSANNASNNYAIQVIGGDIFLQNGTAQSQIKKSGSSLLIQTIDAFSTAIGTNGLSRSVWLSTGAQQHSSSALTGISKWIDYTQVASTAGSITGFSYLGAAHTGQTASFEETDWIIDLSNNVQFLTGNNPLLRNFRFRPRSISYVGASNTTKTVGFSMSQPIAGNNNSTTDNIGFEIETNSVTSGTGTVTNGIAASFNAPTGSSNNYSLKLSGAINLGGTAGNTGQVITSQGSGSTPGWANLSNGSTGAIQTANGSGLLGVGSISTTNFSLPFQSKSIQEKGVFVEQTGIPNSVQNLYSTTSLPNNTLIMIECVVTGVRSTVSPGSSGFAFKVRAAFRKDNTGIVNIIGSSAVDYNLNDTGDAFSPSLSGSGSDIVINTGNTSTKSFSISYSHEVWITKI